MINVSCMKHWKPQRKIRKTTQYLYPQNIMVNNLVSVPPNFFPCVFYSLPNCTVMCMLLCGFFFSIKGSDYFP